MFFRAIEKGNSDENTAARTEVSKLFIPPGKDVEHSALQHFFNKPQIKIYNYIDDIILTWSNVYEELSSHHSDLNLVTKANRDKHKPMHA